jgi:hypothetical protein
MTKEQKLNEEIRSLQKMIAGIPELDDPPCPPASLASLLA